MGIEAIKNRIPEYAKDIKLNLSSIANEETLTKTQLWGCLLASALASGNDFVTREIADEAAQNLSPEAQNAAKAAASIMAMNNIYYRFVHMASNKDYKTLPAKLRMNVIANPGVDKHDFELWSLAVSAINGCGMCIDSHESELIKGGMSKEAIQTAVRIASIVHAASSTISGEEALHSPAAMAA